MVTWAPMGLFFFFFGGDQVEDEESLKKDSFGEIMKNPLNSSFPFLEDSFFEAKL